MDNTEALHRSGGARRVIFFVDDDEQLRNITARLLVSRGYDVLEAESADQAVQVLDKREGDIDVLLMDINLPDGWGASVAQRLKDAKPGMAVVYTTGYADTDPILSGGLNDAQFVVRKPFSADQLVEVLERAIADREKVVGGTEDASRSI